MAGLGQELISKIVGYQINKGDFSESSGNLPQRIAILAESNTANQSNLVLEPKEVISASQAGKLYGYGSPVYSIMRILRNQSGGDIGGIPTVIYPQAEASGATAKTLEVTPAGVADDNTDHTLVIAGRSNIDGSFYRYTVASGDTVADLCTKIADAVNGVLGSPVTAVATTTEVTLTSKWKGKTAEQISVEVETGEKDANITYAVVSTSAGAGTPAVTPALNKFGSIWNTTVVNGYGLESAVLDELEVFNGRASDIPTGRYAAIKMMPFIALSGSTLEDPSTVTDTRADDQTVAVCPAPLSKGFDFEAAANMALIFARISQDSPEQDVQGYTYRDIPTPSDIGLMESYEERDRIVKKGCSTVELQNSSYKVTDFVTTYHPEGEIIPQFRYCRNLVIDFNIKYAHRILVETYVVGAVIAKDSDILSASVSKKIKPKTWRSILDEMAFSLTARALITDVVFTQNSISVEISGSNPDRINDSFKYKRTGFGRIVSTVATAGSNFGNS